MNFSKKTKMGKKNIYISNLCWNKKDNYKIIKFLKREGIRGIDFAPLNYFRSWHNILKNSKRLATIFDNHQIKINAIQGIFYKTKYNIFDVKDKKKITNHFKLIIKLCKIFRTKKIILGSSNFRNPENLNLKEANHIFVNYFKYLNKYLRKDKIILCIETIPKNYKEEYIFELYQLANLITKINSSNIKINFDTSIYHFQKFNKKSFVKNIKLIKNVQISQPYFNYFDKPTRNNLNFIDFVTKNKKLKDISIEIINKKIKKKKFLISIKNIKKFFNS